LAKRAGIPFEQFNPKNGTTPAPVSRSPGIMQDQHSRWFELNALSEYLESDRIFHLIRDPRDVIISGMHYHRASKEAWLHQPEDRFDGLTYQQKINSLPDDTSRYLFQLSHMKAIDRMLAWPMGRAECFECRHESLIGDRNGRTFARALDHLGFDKAESAIALDLYRETHILNGAKSDGVHVRSGVARQWPGVFDRTLAAAFIDRFGEALITLGYEPDNSWFDRL
jgi:hypothetical protein